MTTQPNKNVPSAPNPDDLPPPYSAVVGNVPYGFVQPPSQPFTTTEPGVYPHPVQFTAPGVYPHVEGMQPGVVQHGVSQPVGIALPPAVGTEPTSITCFNCGKVVTTKVTYVTAWHTHLVAGSICIMTMFCSLCCLGLTPYCFDAFKDAEHYCPNCNCFIAKINKC